MINPDPVTSSTNRNIGVTSNTVPTKETIVKHGFSIANSTSLSSLTKLIQDKLESNHPLASKKPTALSGFETKLTTLSQAIKDASSDLKTKLDELRGFNSIDSIKLNEKQFNEIKGLIESIRGVIYERNQAIESLTTSKNYNGELETLKKDMNTLSSELNIVQGKTTLIPEAEKSSTHQPASNSSMASDAFDGLCHCLYGIGKVVGYILDILYIREMMRLLGKGCVACVSAFD